MTEPNTVNVGLIIPNTGDLPGTWGSAALNPDFVAIDGYLGGVQTISLSNSNVTLTSPAGASITPSGGPTQAQNAVLYLTGTLSANVKITFPLPGIMSVANFTTGNYVVTLAAASAGEIVGIPQGTTTDVFNNGTNVKFRNLGDYTSKLAFYAGLSAVPAWITACTVRPYLYCDGSVYNYSDYVALSAIVGGSFGGNGITTFATPDLRGRVPLAYDGTGTRITTAGCGINGQTMGASGGEQTHTLLSGELPANIPNSVSTTWNLAYGGNAAFNAAAGGTQTVADANAPTFTTTVTINPLGGGAHNNVQPAQVAGIWLIKT